MDVYLIDETNNYTFHFPVNPQEKISAPKERRYRTEEVLHKGEVDIHMEGKKISEISFESFFPLEYDDSYCRYNYFMSPLECKNKLNEWVDADNPFRLIIDDLGINELVNIAKFTPDIKAGEVGDIYYSITFRTHQDLKITTVNDSEDSYQGGLIDYNNRSFANDYYNAGDKVKVVLQANVYNGPGQNFDNIGTLEVGKTYIVYEQWDEWVSIEDYGLYGGYVHRGFITKE